MYTGVRVPCFPTPLEIGTNDEATLRQWTPGTREFRSADNEFARMCRAMGASPWRPGEETMGGYDFLLTTKQDREHGKYFYYTDPNPMALQWILERTTNTSYVDHLGKLLRDVGAEHNGTIVIDAIGTAVSSIGMSLTARDFARWGLMLCNGGQVPGKVVAGIKDFVDDIRRNPGPERWTERTNAKAWALANTGYRSLMWTTPAESGVQPIPSARGAHAQSCYVDVARNTVLVKFSSFLASKPDRPIEDRSPQNETVAIQCFLEQALPEFVG
jgi:CubicO group peptidase (beta-lactamase class C family)